MSIDKDKQTSNVEETVVLDLSSFSKAITSLEQGVSAVDNIEWFSAQSEEVQNTMIAGVIQNFEFVYELAVKMIRRRLELDAITPTEIDFSNFRDLLRRSAENGLINNVEAWFTYRQMRNITSQAYDHEKAQQVYKETLSFMKDARLLFSKLEERNA